MLLKMIIENVYALLYTNAKAIAKKYNIECEILTCKDVEDTFLKLNDDNIIDVIGNIPDPLNINNVEYGVMKEVIDFLLKRKGPKIKS